MPLYSGAPGLSGYVPKVSAARPGVTKLYRRESDSGYNLQTEYDGSRWFLRGYNGDVLHSGVRVDRADSAGYADAAYRLAGAQIFETGSALVASFSGSWVTVLRLEFTLARNSICTISGSVFNAWDALGGVRNVHALLWMDNVWKAEAVQQRIIDYEGFSFQLTRGIILGAGYHDFRLYQQVVSAGPAIRVANDGNRTRLDVVAIPY